MKQETVPDVAATVELSPGDTCDKHGPGVPANTAVRLRSGDILTFCNHCYAVYQFDLVELIVAIARNEVK